MTIVSLARFGRFKMIVWKMNNISKPHLVRLLRIFDRMKWFQPRIRYASVRSKPELMYDLHRYFGSSFDGSTVLFLQKTSCPRNLPSIHYCLTERQFYFDGRPMKPSEKLPRAHFEIRHGPVTIHFGGFQRSTNQLSR